MARITTGPRLLPAMLVIMLVLVGIKSAGIVSHALAEGTPAGSKSAPRAASAQPPVPALGPVAAPVAAGQQPQVITPSVGKAADDPPVSEAERGLLLDLRKRRGELDSREMTIAAREGVLAAAEKRLAARVDELTNLQGRLQALEEARRQRDEVNWRGLVKLYETMKPREAAAIFNDLDKPVLLAVLDRMKEGKAAPILAAMNPERARQVTADLAQMRTQANRAPAAPPGCHPSTPSPPYGP